jgi:hypothetical protein
VSSSNSLLENIKPKLPSKERKKVGAYLNQLRPTKYLFIRSSISELDEDAA